MPDKITDIRTHKSQLAMLHNLIVEALPVEQHTPQFVIAAKLNDKDNFVLDMFFPATLIPDNFKQRIICSLSENSVRNFFNSCRFRLDGFEAYPTEKLELYYTVTYFK